MAIENAKKFVEKVKADAALSERMKDMKPEEGLALAKEMGLEFTEAELKSALNNRELSPDELDEGVGGITNGGAVIYNTARQQDRCTYSENLQHDWQYIGHSEEPDSFLWIEFTRGYDHFKCSLCGQTKKTYKRL